MVGAPHHEPTDLSRRCVMIARAMRIKADVIAQHLGISRDTLDRHYRAEIDKGKIMVDMLCGQALVTNIEKGDMTAIKFYMINQMGFKEKSEIDVKNTQPEIPLFLQEFNRIIDAANSRSRTLDHAPLVQDGLVLPADDGAATE